MKLYRNLVALLALLALVIAACGGEDGGSDDGETTTTAPPTTAPPNDSGGDDDMVDDEPSPTTAPPTTEAMDDMDDMDDDSGPVTVRWFVGLGTGSNVDIIPPQEELVAEFNASQNEIILEVEFVENNQAYGILNTQLAAGDPPDLVGPVGLRGRNSFPGAWLDLQPLVDARGYDLSDFDPELVQFYETPGEGLLGIPFGIAPAMLFYNIDLFDEAGLAYPPSDYGSPYITADGEEKPWNLETLQELACLLTVDANGNDCTSPNLDTDNMAQFGWGSQWTDLRGKATLFGAASLVDENGNAQVPDAYREAMQWYQELAWEEHSYPFADWGGSEIFGGSDNWFVSGNMAMANIHMWYATCCLGSMSSAWQIAPIPEGPRGTVAKLHADTFAITKQSENPEAAFTIMEWILGSAATEFLPIYGFLPARVSLQGAYFGQLNETDSFAGRGINWDVALAGLDYLDNPSHEGPLPNLPEVEDCYSRIDGKVFSIEGFDIDSAFDQLLLDLPGLFDGTGTCSLEQ